MKIGLRTLKTGIAVTISLLVVQLLGLESVIFITIAALIGMQPTVSDSWKAGGNRIIGTVVGTVFGLVVALLLPSHFLLAGLGVILLIHIMNRLKNPEGITIGCVVFISIYMNTQTDVNTLSFALSRLFDTFLGITIGLMVNYFILPPKYDAKALVEMRKDMMQIMACQNRILGLLLGKEDVALAEISDQMELILTEINETKKLADMQEKEERLNVYGSVLFAEINLILQITTDMYQHLQNLFGLVNKGVAPTTLQPVEKDLLKLYQKLKEQEAVMEKDILLKQTQIQELEHDVTLIKDQIKSEKIYRYMGTEEIIQLMVMVYNIGEILGKMDMISARQHA